MYVLSTLKNLSDIVLNTVFPNKCVNCRQQRTSSAHTLCLECWQRLAFITSPHCCLCSKPKVFEQQKCPCEFTKCTRNYYHRVRSALLYEGVAKNLIKRFKYGGHTNLQHIFAKWLYSNVAQWIEDSHVIIPIPLHVRKLRERGYNQAWLIAKLLAKHYNKACIENALFRSRYTMSQSNLSHWERQQNILGAFMINDKYAHVFENRNVILVDDVITTGATANECAKVLAGCGARRINILTIART
ncbi:competence protein ComFC [Alphaproteobacteria bacterium]